MALRGAEGGVGGGAAERGRAASPRPPGAMWRGRGVAGGSPAGGQGARPGPAPSPRLFCVCWGVGGLPLSRSQPLRGVAR